MRTGSPIGKMLTLLLNGLWVTSSKPAKSDVPHTVFFASVNKNCGLKI
jgi:hypothetical protein